jgi:hypothetical protein
MSYQRFSGMLDVIDLQDRTTLWIVENRMESAGAIAMSNTVTYQLLL